MAENSIVERKRAMRSAALSRRNSLDPQDWAVLGGSVQARALGFGPYRSADVVALYSAIQNEVPTDAIRQDSLSTGKRVFYPKLAGANSVELAEIRSVADLAAGRLGMDEPVRAPSRLGADHETAVVFVPGLVFDSFGNRLGRGIGWYDRLINKTGRTAVFVALAYEFQLVANVPTESWDEKVDYIITENRVIDCSMTAPRARAVS
jgi:5-formyltetrahydrofolate cyclo-ligase